MAKRTNARGEAMLEAAPGTLVVASAVEEVFEGLPEEVLDPVVEPDVEPDVEEESVAVEVTEPVVDGVVLLPVGDAVEAEVEEPEEALADAVAPMGWNKVPKL